MRSATLYTTNTLEKINFKYIFLKVLDLPVMVPIRVVDQELIALSRLLCVQIQHALCLVLLALEQGPESLHGFLPHRDPNKSRGRAKLHHFLEGDNPDADWRAVVS